jgi:hypothetical protein
MPNAMRMLPYRRGRRPLLLHERLIVDCVTSTVSGRTEAAGQGHDWPSFVTTCVRHGVAQPAARLLLNSEAHIETPKQVRAVLERLLAGNRERNLTLYAELARLLTHLSSDGVEALVLKGVALSLTVYPDYALRNFADVDILVREEQFERAHEIALAAGWNLQDEREPGHHHAVYERILETDILSGTVAPEFDPELSRGRLAPYTHRLRLEIHRSPFFDISGAAIPVDLEPFWSGARTARFPSGASFSLPRPEAMLVHLCSHAASHGFQKLQFVLDVALLLQRYGSVLDPQLVRGLAQEYKATDHVRRLLRFVDEELEDVSASPILAALPPGSSAPLSWAEILDCLEAGRSATRVRHWLSAGSKREFIHGAFRMLAPTPAAMRRIYGKYHPAFLPALYLWRPIQLSGRLFKVILRRTARPLARPRKEYPCPGSEPS